MIEQGLLNKNIVGQEGFQWWIGQVVNAEQWQNNIPDNPQRTNQTIQGFGERYKVRIMGYHTCSTEDLPDEDLPWASVMYPVTGGGGGRNHYTNANIVQGTFVFGFFLDGSQGQVPVIMGCMGYNDYQAVRRNIPEDCGFIPFSGYDENDGGKIATVAANSNPSGQIVADQEAAADQGANINDAWSEGIGATSSVEKIVDEAAYNEDQDTKPNPETSQCEPMPVGQIQKQMQNVVNEIERVRRAATEYKYSITKGVGNTQAKIDALIQQAAKFISGNMKMVYGKIQKAITNTINAGTKSLYNNLMPNEMQDFKTRMDGMNDIIACLFKRMIEGLFGMMFDFLSGMFDRAVNITRCFVDNFIGNLLGQAMGTINGVIQGALGALTGIAGLAGGLMGGLTSISTSISGLVADILSFLTCEETAECSPNKDWSIVGGAGSLGAADIGSIFGQMNAVASQAASVVQAAGGQVQASIDGLNNLSVGFGDVANQTCSDGTNSSTDPFYCGPPLVTFLGGQGSTPPVGNALINAAGAILGVDLMSYGINVDSGLNISVGDTCGTGTNSAVLTPVLGQVNAYRNISGDPSTNNTPPNTAVWEQLDPNTLTTNPPAWREGNTYQPGDVVQHPRGPGDSGPSTIGVVAVNVPRPGRGYLPRADGSTGGAGRVWARPDDTSVIRDSLPGESDDDDGIREIPRAPGHVMNVTPGDRVLLPPGTRVILEPSGEEILGGTEHVVQETGSFTTPTLPTAVDPTTGLVTDPTTGVVTDPTTGRTVDRDVGFTVPTGTYPSDSDGSYPVILYLCEMTVQSPGVRYKETDEVIIKPDRGAQASIKVNDMGMITSVKITSGGEGFQEMPQVYVKSNTGFNADILPRFCIDRISDDKLKEPGVQDKIINVVDCVGRVPESLYAPCKNCNDTSMVW